MKPHLFLYAILMTASLSSATDILAQTREYFLFVGTYTKGKSEGIYTYRFNTATGATKKVGVAKTPNPSYLTLSPDGNNLYCVNENGDNDKGQVTAFKLSRKSGLLEFINKQSAGGDAPCYIAEDSSSTWVFCGNYTGGSCAAFRVDAAGGLEGYSQLIQHEGKSVNTDRQERAHVHASVFTPDHQYLLTPDLGMDILSVYKFDAKASKEPLSLVDTVKTVPGSGPRHITFHPNGEYAYLIEELGGMVSAYRYNDGKFQLFQHIDAHKVGFKGKRGSADIHTSPDGKFLYASNRGDANNITIFSIDQANGMLKTVGYEPVRGATPRNFTIDPSGKYLIVANQDSGNIVFFTRDSRTGLLHYTGKQLKVDFPVCLKLLATTP